MRKPLILVVLYVTGVNNMTQAYCVKCRKKVEVKNAEKVTMKNGRPATKGKCPACGTGVYRIGK